LKIRSHLPPRGHFKAIPSTTEGIWLFEDKLTPALRVRSPTPDPWAKEWVILFSPQHQKSDKSQYPYRLILRLYPDGDAPNAAITREFYKGVFAWARQPLLAHYVFLVEPEKSTIPLWITYSIRLDGRSPK
jgi:hypothetical protein